MPFTKIRPMPMSLWTSEPLMRLEPAVKWTAVSLRAIADDHGRGSRTDWMLRTQLYPRGEVSVDEFESHLIALALADVIVLYEVGDGQFFAIVEWPGISHKQESEFPDPPEGFRNVSGAFLESFSAREREGARESEEASGRLPGEPSPFCPTHESTLGTDEDCRGCGRRRLGNREWWRRYHANKAAERQDDDG